MYGTDMLRFNTDGVKLVIRSGKECNKYYYSNDYILTPLTRDYRTVVKSITRTKDNMVIGFIITEFKPEYAPIRTRAFVLDEEALDGKGATLDLHNDK